MTVLSLDLPSIQPAVKPQLQLYGHGCMVPATFHPGKQPGHGSWLLGLGEAANVQEPARFQPRKESTLSVGPGEWLADVWI